MQLRGLMSKKYNYEKLIEEGIEDDFHVNGERDESKLSNVEIDANYKFRIKNPIGKFFAGIFYCIAALVVPFVLYIAYGIRFRGRRNLRNLKNTGAVAISNHVLTLDFLTMAQAVFPKKLYYQVLESSMKLPFVRYLLKAGGCMPIPTKQSAKRVYIEEVDKILKEEKKIVGMYPEAALWPYYNKIRKFKPGAFHFAVKNDVPIIPIMINFRAPRGFQKLLNMKVRYVTVHIGKPIYANKDLPFNESVTELMERSHNVMERMNHWFKVIDNGKVTQLEKLNDEII